MKKLLISRCLLGDFTRYDGGTNKLSRLKEIIEHFELFPLCPEVDGGLSTPRAPSEIIDERVLNSQGIDNTTNFLFGASQAVEIVHQHNITLALLKSKSPSCGKQKIYDGSFTHTLIDGQGMTVQQLKKHCPHLIIYDESEIDELLKHS